MMLHRNIHSLSQSGSLCLWAGVVTTEHAALWCALRRRRWLRSNSQRKSFVHQDINCKTGDIALVQRLPPGTQKTDGFISTQPFTSALQLRRNTNKFPAIFAKQFYSCLSEIKAPSLGCALHFYSYWQFFFPRCYTQSSTQFLMLRKIHDTKLMKMSVSDRTEPSKGAFCIICVIRCFL